MKSRVVPQISIPSRDEPRTPSITLSGAPDNTRLFISPSRTPVHYGKDTASQIPFSSVRDFAVPQLDSLLSLNGASVQQTSSDNSQDSEPSNFLLGLLHLHQQGSSGDHVLLNNAAVADGSATRRSAAGPGGLTPPSQKTFCRQPSSLPTPNSGRPANVGKTFSGVHSEGFSPIDISANTSSVTEWVCMARFSVYSLLSYTHLRTVLQLIRDAPFHPLVLHTLSHPFTVERLSRCADKHFLQNVFDRIFCVPTALKQSVKSDETLSKSTPAVAEHNFFPAQRTALSFLGLSSSLPILHRSVGHIVALLDIDVPLALDVLLALLLKRRLATPLVTDACVDEKNVYTDSLTSAYERLPPSIEEMHSVLDLRFSEVDLYSLGWSDGCTEKVLSVFVEEMKAYMDCITLVSSIDLDPHLRLAKVFLKEDREAPVESVETRSASRTQRYHLTHVTRSQRLVQKVEKYDKRTQLYIFSLLRLRTSLDLRAIRQSLWRCFTRLSSLDPRSFREAFESEAGLSRTPDLIDATETALTQELSTKIALMDCELISMGFRASLVLGAYILGCITALIRFSPAEAGYTSLVQVQDATEFIVQRRYCGLLGYLIVLQECGIVDMILVNSQSLLSVAQDLVCASVAFVVALHQLYKAPSTEGSWFKSGMECIERTGCLSHDLRAFHNSFISEGSSNTQAPQEDTNAPMDFWRLVQFGNSIGTFAHAVFCAGVVRSASRHEGRVSGFSDAAQLEDESFHSFALSIIPDRCLSFARALHMLRLTPTPTPVLATSRGTNGVPPARSASSGCHFSTYSSCLLWSYSDNDLPCCAELGLTDTVRAHSTGLPDILKESLTSRCFSVSAALRHTLFDLVDAVTTSVKLPQLRGQELIMDFAAELFAADSTIASRAFVHKYWSDSSETCEQCPCYSERDACMAQCVSRCRSTFWATVVEDYLMNFIPYSIPLLLRLITSLISCKKHEKDLGNVLPLEDRLSRNRFVRIMSLLNRPCSSVCFPPLLQNVVPASHDGLATALVPKSCRPSWGTTARVAVVAEPGGDFSGDAVLGTPAPWSSFVPPSKRSMLEHERCRYALSVHHGEESDSSCSEDCSVDDQDKSSMFYAINGSLSLESMLCNVFGIEDSSYCENRNCLKGGRVYGRVVPMPLESLPWLGLSIPPMPLRSPESPLIFPLHKLKTVLPDSSTIQLEHPRRYRGHCWAVGCLTTGCDAAQSWSRPIDVKMLDNFAYSFTERCKDQQLRNTPENVFVDLSGKDAVSLTPNPFCRIENFNSIREPWMAYQLFSLSPGNEAPYTIQWDLTDVPVSFSLLRILWILWSYLIQDVDSFVTEKTPFGLNCPNNLSKINLLSQIVQFFSTYLAVSPMGYPALRKLVLANETEGQEMTFKKESPFALFMRFYQSFRLSLILGSNATIDDGPSASQRLLFVASTCGLMVVMRPVPLDDVRLALSMPSANALFDAMWNRPHQTEPWSPLHFEPLGPVSNAVHTHWLFRLLCSPILNASFLSVRWCASLPVANLLSGFKQITQLSLQRDLCFVTLDTAVQFASFLLRLTPPVLWTRSALDEALTLSQMTRETIDTLVRSQESMTGDWNFVDDYVKEFEQELWQVIKSFLPPSPTMYDELTPDENRTLDNAVSICRSAVLEQAHGVADLQLFQAIVEIVFNIGWQQSGSLLVSWTVLERARLSKTFIAPLNVLASSLTALNSNDLDRQVASNDEKVEGDAAYDYQRLVPNLRAIQNCVLNVIAEHNVLASLIALTTCDGHLSVVDDTDGPNQSVSPLRVTQRFTNNYLLQAYYFDLLEAQYCFSTTVLPSATLLMRTSGVACNSGGAERGAVEEVKKVLAGYLRFILHLTTVVYGYTSMDTASPSNQETSATTWGFADFAPSLLFTKLAATLLDPQAETLRRRSWCPWGGDFKASLLSCDVFEGLDNRFMLDFNFEKTTKHWTFEVNFLMSLVIWARRWGDSTFADAPVLTRLLLDGTAKYIRLADETSSLGTSLKGDVSKASSLVSRLLIKLPPEFHYFLAKRVDPQGFEKQGTSRFSTAAWTLLSQLEGTLVTNAIVAFVVAPSRLSVLCCSLNEFNSSRVGFLCMTLQPSVFEVPHFFGLLRESFLRHFKHIASSSSNREQQFPKVLLGFIEFWLCHFLIQTKPQNSSAAETKEGSKAQPQNASHVALDKLRMVHVSLDLLTQLLDRYTGNAQILSLMTLPCRSLFRDITGDLPPLNYRLYFPRGIAELSGWALLRMVTQRLLHLWTVYERLRYGNLEKRLPTTDMVLSEQIFHRVCIPTRFTKLAGAFPPFGSSHFMSAHDELVAARSVFSEKQTQQRELSFLYLPIIIECFTQIVAIVGQVIVNPFAISCVGKHSKSAATEISSKNSTRNTHTKHDKGLSHEEMDGRNTSVSPSCERMFLPDSNSKLPLVLQSVDFVDLYSYLTASIESPALLFSDSDSVKADSSSAFAADGCLIPSTLAARLMPSWFTAMEKRRLFEILPLPLCPTCYSAPQHPLRLDMAESSNTSTPIFDCNLLYGCPLPNASRKLLRDLMCVVFGASSVAFSQQLEVNTRNNERRLAGSDRSEVCLPSTRLFGADAVVDRSTLFQFALFAFGIRLWERAVEAHFGRSFLNSLTTSEINEYMGDTFVMLEISSVVATELCINRLKHTALVQLTGLLSKSKASKLFPLLLSRTLAKTLDPPEPNTHTSDLKAANGLCSDDLNQLKPFLSFIYPTAKALFKTLKTRADLCGRGRDALVCSSRLGPAAHNLSFAGALMDFMVQLCIANWESDARTLRVAAADSHEHDQLAVASEKALSSRESMRVSPSKRLSAEGFKELVDSSVCTSVRKLRSELLPYIDTTSPDCLGGCSTCLSSLFQLQMLKRPVARHPRGIWLVYSSCFCLPSVPSIDTIEALQRQEFFEVSSNITSPASDVVVELISCVWARCLATLKRFPSAACSKNGEFGFQNLSDICRGILLLQLLIRLWVTNVMLNPSLNLLDLLTKMDPIRYLFQSILEELPVALTQLAPALNVVLSNNGTCDVMRRLLAVFSDNSELSEICWKPSAFQVYAAESEAILGLAAPSFLFSLACTILEVVKSASAAQWKDRHQRQPDAAHSLKRGTVERELLQKSKPWDEMFNGFLSRSLEASSMDSSTPSILHHVFLSCSILAKLPRQQQLTAAVAAGLKHHRLSSSLVDGLSSFQTMLCVDGVKTSQRVPESVFSRTYRSLWVTSINLASLLGAQLSLCTLALINYLSIFPTVARTLQQMNLASVLASCPGAYCFTKPLATSQHLEPGALLGNDADNQFYCVKEDASGVFPLYESSHEQLKECWRPVYEYHTFQLNSVSTDNAQKLELTSSITGASLLQNSLPCSFRSVAHVVWCRYLHYIYLTHRNSSKLTTAASLSAAAHKVTESRVGEVVVRYYDRFRFVMESTLQYGQLGLLEEFCSMTRILAALPALEQKRPLFHLVLKALKTIRGLGQTCLGRGQIEMSEVFKPVSVREIYAADLSQNGIEMALGSRTSADHRALLFSGQQATRVPSLYHQRVLVLVIKAMQNVLRCLRGLRLEQWSGEGLDRTLERSEQRQGCHEEKYNASSFSCPPTASNFFCDDRNTEKDCGVSLSINGDFLETVFHEVVDVGRLMLQLMEDLPKLQTPAFIAVCTQNSVLLPLALGLRCEEQIESDIAPLVWPTTTTQHPISSRGAMASYHDVDLPATLQQQGTTLHSDVQSFLTTPRSGVFSPRQSHRPLFSTTPLTACGNPLVNDASPKLTPSAVGGTSLMPWDASTVVSRRSSPLVQRYSTGASAGRGTVSSRPLSPIRFYRRLVRADNVLLQSDPNTDGDCLPECVTLVSVLRVIQSIVETSLFLSFSLFNSLASDSTGAAARGALESVDTLPASGVVFGRPSVVRRLSEFLAAMQARNVEEHFHHLHPLIGKMMTITSIRLGDDPTSLLAPTETYRSQARSMSVSFRA